MIRNVLSNFQIALKALSDRLSKVETSGSVSASVAGTSSWPTLEDEPLTKSNDATSVHRSTTPSSIDDKKNEILIDIDASATNAGQAPKN